MIMNKQQQKAGDNSQLVQADRDANINHYHYGPSIDEVKQIALQIFEANFYKLSNEAHSIALQRVELLTEKILHRLHEEHPTGINSVNDPDFQYAMYSAQKEYARSGDDNIGDILVDLISERCKVRGKSVRNIICDESINAISRLNGDMLSALGVVFFFRHYSGELKIDDSTKALRSRYPNLSKISLIEFFNKHFTPFNSLMYSGEYLYRHMESVSCCKLTKQKNDSLLDLISKNFSGYFQSGFTKAELDNSGIDRSAQHKLIIKSLNNPNKLQFNALNEYQLSLLFGITNLENEVKKKLNSLYRSNLLNRNDIGLKIVNTCPGMGELFGIWDRTSLGKMELTGSGIALGYAALKNHAPDIPDLSYWIN